MAAHLIPRQGLEFRRLFRAVLRLPGSPRARMGHERNIGDLLQDNEHPVPHLLGKIGIICQFNQLRLEPHPLRTGKGARQ